MLKIIIICVGVLLFADTCLMFFVSNKNAGIWALGGFSLMLTAYGLGFDLFEEYPFVHIVMAVGIGGFFVVCVLLYLYGKIGNVKYDEDAVIVLGSGIRGEHVSRNLAKRLDKAIEYHKKNPNAYIIVSGGQGRDEQISESQAMEKYLLTKGIAQEKIIKEDKSTTTEENFLFSFEIMKKNNLSKDKAVYVTSAFHVYRAGLLVKRCGILPRHLGANIVWYTIPMSYMREVMAIVRTYIALWGIKEL